MKPYNKMRLIAPPKVIDAAVDLNAAMFAMPQATTESFAQPVTKKAAGDAIEKFFNVFRAEIVKDMYTATKAQERTISFLANLKQQVHGYMEEAKASPRRRIRDAPCGRHAAHFATELAELARELVAVVQADKYSALSEEGNKFAF